MCAGKGFSFGHINRSTIDKFAEDGAWMLWLWSAMLFTSKGHRGLWHCSKFIGPQAFRHILSVCICFVMAADYLGPIFRELISPRTLHSRPSGQGPSSWTLSPNASQKESLQQQICQAPPWNKPFPRHCLATRIKKLIRVRVIQP
jgi:hypothetical protein